MAVPAIAHRDIQPAVGSALRCLGRFWGGGLGLRWRRAAFLGRLGTAVVFERKALCVGLAFVYRSWGKVSVERGGRRGGLACECPAGQPKQQVSSRVRVLSAVPAYRIFGNEAVCALRVLAIAARVDVEYAVELAKHEAEHARGDTQRRAEHDADVAHRHLVHVRVLHDKDEVRSQGAEEAVVSDRERGDEPRELFNPFLGVYKICGGVSMARVREERRAHL